MNDGGWTVEKQNYEKLQNSVNHYMNSVDRMKATIHKEGTTTERDPVRVYCAFEIEYTKIFLEK